MRRVFAVADRTWRHAIVRFPTFITWGFVCPECRVASRRLDTNGFDRAMNSGVCTLERAVASSKPMRSDTSHSGRAKVRGDAPRWERRRVGKGGVGTCRTRGCTHLKKKKK